MARSARTTEKDIESLKHREARRKHIPTTELETLVSEDEQAPKTIRWKRNTDLDPQLVWRGKDEQDSEDLMVDSVPIYIQEKIKPEKIISDLKRRSEAIRRERAENEQYAIPDLYGDFNGLAEPGSEFDFYKHDKNWSNRMILGDSLLVMTSLAGKEALKGQVQCISLDPPYGISFNSNWQPSTKSRDVKDGQADGLSREPEMIRAFRDTWKDGVHSYLSYLRDRLTVARDLLFECGSIFVQIGEENVHLVRGLMDEVYGDHNFVVQLILKKTGTLVGEFIESINDYIIWYAKDKTKAKFKRALKQKIQGDVVGYQYVEYKHSSKPVSQAAKDERDNGRLWGSYPLHSQGFRNTTTCSFVWQGRTYHSGMTRNWKVATDGLTRLGRADSIVVGENVLRFKRYFDDFQAINVSNNWEETFTAADRIYVPLLKTEWVPLKIGPLLFIDRMVSNDAASYALVKAEAAAGGGRRPAFTRA
jgi:adenine-specific DNA-methyltransferase